MIQYIPKAHMFQCVLFKDGNFYQAHDLITPPKGEKEMSIDDITKCGVLYLDTAMIIADKIEEANEADKQLLEKRPKKGLVN